MTDRPATTSSSHGGGAARVRERRIRAAAGQSLPIASPPVFRAAEGRPAAAQLQRVFAVIEETFKNEQQMLDNHGAASAAAASLSTTGSPPDSPVLTSAARQKATLDALLKAFAEEKEAGRSNAERTLSALRIERTLAKDETDEADRLRSIVLNAVARALNEALSVCEAAAVNSMTVGDGKGSTSGGGGVLRSGLSSCARGLVLPYDFYRRAVDLSTVAVDSTYEHWVTRGHARVSLAADEAAARGVAHTTETLEELERVMASDTAVFTPSQLARFSAVRGDCLAAMRAALVWRMLHQVQGNVGGMSEATRAFEALLPCIFSGIEVKELPHMPSLGGQVLQLLRFPTLSTEIDMLRTSADHLRADAQYFRRAMQHWAVTIWFRQLVGERRKTAVLERVGGCFDRLARRNVKRKAFAAWKMLATRGRIARFVLKTSHELQDAMSASRVSDAGLTPGSGAAAAAAAAAARHGQPQLDDLSCLQSSEPWTLLGETALDAVKTLTIVCSAFRVQIARQKETIDRVEREREHLRDKVSLLEGKLMRQIEMTNTKTNEAERLSQQLYEARCSHSNATSRLLQQEHVPWRQQAMDFIKQIAVVPPLRPAQAPEQRQTPFVGGDDDNNDDSDQDVAAGGNDGDDAARFHNSSNSKPFDGASSFRSGSSAAGGDAAPRGVKSPTTTTTTTTATTTKQQQQQQQPRPPKLVAPGGKGGAASSSARQQRLLSQSSSLGLSVSMRRGSNHSSADDGAASDTASNKDGGGMGPTALTADALQQQAQQQRLLADPFAVKLDDPELVLARWINQCLDDLQALENGSNAAIAVLRCSNKFSWEWSDSLLLSRLLYFLALPKFATNGAYGSHAQAITAAAAALNNGFLGSPGTRGATGSRTGDGAESVFAASIFGPSTMTTNLGGGAGAQSQFDTASNFGGGARGGGGRAASLFSAGLPSMRARSSFVQSFSRVGSIHDVFSQVNSTFGHKTIASLLPSTKNVDMVLEFSASCREMLLDGSASVQVFTPEAAEKALAEQQQTQQPGRTSPIAASGGGGGATSPTGGSPIFAPAMLSQTRSTLLQQQKQAANVNNNRSSVYSLSPSYQECFHDFSVAAAKRRCETVVHLAQELLDLSVPPVVVADVLTGQKPAILLLLTLLYLKFAHPLSHGRASGIEPAPPDVVRINGSNGGSNGNSRPPFATQSSFDLFESQQRQQQQQQQQPQTSVVDLNRGAVSRTDIIAGTLWEVAAVDNPQVLREVCTWATAMRRSLEEHRWHVARELLFVDAIVGRDPRTRHLALLRRQAADDHLSRQFDGSAGAALARGGGGGAQGARGGAGASLSSFANRMASARRPTAPTPAAAAAAAAPASSGNNGRARSPLSGSVRTATPIADGGGDGRRSRSPIGSPSRGVRSKSPSGGLASSNNDPPYIDEKAPPAAIDDEDAAFIRHCVSVFATTLETCQQQYQVKAANAAAFVSASSYSYFPAAPRPSSPPLSATASATLRPQSPQQTLLDASSAPAAMSSGHFGGGANAAAVAPVAATTNLLEHIEVDLCAQLDAALPKLHDAFTRRSVVEWDSGGARGLRQAALVDLFADADLVPHVITRDQLHNVMAAERFARDGGGGLATGPGAGMMTATSSTGALLGVGRTFSREASGGGGGGMLAPSSSLTVPGMGYGRSSSPTAAASMMPDGRLVCFDEFLGVIARVSHLQVVKWSQERGGSAPASGFRCQVLQRLTVLADSGETARFMAMLDSVAVAERFAQYRLSLQELFDAAATMPDDAINRLAGIPSASSINHDPSSSLLTLDGNNGGNNRLIITLDNFMKLVQESFMSITPELVRHVFDEAVRATNLKAKRLSTGGATFRNKSRGSSLGGGGNSGGGGGHAAAAQAQMMNYGCFLRAVALLAHVHDPLPTLSFHDRLTRFLPLFCDSVRPVVMAMQRAKNQETDRRVKDRSAESRTKTSDVVGIAAAEQSQKQQQQLVSALKKSSRRNSPVAAASAAEQQNAKKSTRDFLGRR